MPSFDRSTRTRASVEDVWKLLYDPSRFPEWWAGIAAVRPDGPDAYTIWPQGYPDFPMAQQLATDRAESRVTISCLVSDLVFRWQLLDLESGTQIDVHVELPEAEAARLPEQEQLVADSLARLAALALTP